MASIPSARPLQTESFLPPKKISLGKLGGIRSPPGLNRQDKTGTGQGQGNPQEQEALLGQLGSWGFFWAWHDIRGPHRVPQQPLPLPRQGGRRLEWPPWPQQEEPPAPDESPWTRQGSLKCSCGHNKTDTRHSWPWRVDSIHGARVSGGLQAWVSGDPAGLSQRQSGGHESVAGRRALSQRRAGGVISRERHAWGSGNPGTSRQAWESHRRRRISPAFGGHEGSRPAGSRRSRRTPTPNSHADLQWAMAGITSGDFLAAWQTQTLEQNKTRKN